MKPSVAVAIPAYNEAEGLGGFLQEIDEALAPHVDSLTIVVVDDASKDDTPEVLTATAAALGATLEVITNQVNRGHGISLVSAYRRAIATGADFVLQVDGDGQFLGGDLRRILVLLLDQAHAVSGVRRFRQDPWFRMAMTRVVRHYVGGYFAVRARDPNCPLRGYEAQLLAELLALLPDDCLVPNLYLTILAARHGVPMVEVDVSHQVRRGASRQGSSWDRGRASPVPWRLLRFSVAALRESIAFHAQLGRAAENGPAQPVPTLSEEDPRG